MRKRLIAILMVVLLLTLFSSACFSTEETIQYEGDRQMQATIKVMHLDNKEDFRKRYVDIFNSKYSNIEIEHIVFLSSDDFLKKYKEEKPDIVFLTLEAYTQLIEENKLYDLSTLLSNDDFNLEGIHPEIFVSFCSGKGKSG